MYWSPAPWFAFAYPPFLSLSSIHINCKYVTKIINSRQFLKATNGHKRIFATKNKQSRFQFSGCKQVSQRIKNTTSECIQKHQTNECNVQCIYIFYFNTINSKYALYTALSCNTRSVWLNVYINHIYVLNYFVFSSSFESSVTCTQTNSHVFTVYCARIFSAVHICRCKFTYIYMWSTLEVCVFKYREICRSQCKK